MVLKVIVLGPKANRRHEIFYYILPRKELGVVFLLHKRASGQCAIIVTQLGDGKRSHRKSNELDLRCKSIS